MLLDHHRAVLPVCKMAMKMAILVSEDLKNYLEFCDDLNSSEKLSESYRKIIDAYRKIFSRYTAKFPEWTERRPYAGGEVEYQKLSPPCLTSNAPKQNGKHT